MKDKEILKKAIEKANNDKYTMKWGWPKDDVDMDIIVQERALYIIFSHSFAKAFWGEDDYAGFYIYKEGDINIGAKAFQIFNDERDRYKKWMYHLQKRVLEEKPVKYLEQFLTDNIPFAGPHEEAEWKTFFKDKKTLKD